VVFPRGAKADDQGRLIEDIDGHPLDPDRRTVGRRVVGGSDERLSEPSELVAAAEEGTGRNLAKTPLPRRTLGYTSVNRYSGRPNRVGLSGCNTLEFERSFTAVSQKGTKVMTKVALSKTPTDTPARPTEGRPVAEWWADLMKEYQAKSTTELREKELSEESNWGLPPDERLVTTPGQVARKDK
jgi:hypothetical protein